MRLSEAEKNYQQQDLHNSEEISAPKLELQTWPLV